MAAWMVERGRLLMDARTLRRSRPILLKPEAGYRDMQARKLGHKVLFQHVAIPRPGHSHRLPARLEEVRPDDPSRRKCTPDHGVGSLQVLLREGVGILAPPHPAVLLVNYAVGKNVLRR